MLVGLLLMLVGASGAAWTVANENDQRLLQLGEIASQANLVHLALDNAERERGLRLPNRPGEAPTFALTIASQGLARLRELMVELETRNHRLHQLVALLPDVARLRAAETMGEVPALREVLARLRAEAEAECASMIATERWQSVGTTVLPGLAGCFFVGFGLIAQGRRGARNRQLRETRYRALRAVAPVGTALLDPQLRLLEVDGDFARLAEGAVPALKGMSLAEALPSLAGELTAFARSAFASGEALGTREIDGRTSGGRPYRVMATVQPMLDRRGQAFAACLALIDVTPRAEAEAARHRTALELNHRVKNTLATVQSLAAQTLRVSGDDPSRFRQQFAARLQAVARSHDLLTNAGWGLVSLQDAVDASLAGPLAIGRIVIEETEPAWLRPPQVQAIVLALQELLDNAQRHGSLAGPQGNVFLCWHHGPDGLLHVIWREERVALERSFMAMNERGGREGFGMRLLRRVLPQDLGQGSAVDLRFPAEGLVCTLTFRAEGAASTKPGFFRTETLA